MKITIAALKKVIAEGAFEEGMRHVNEAAIADLYSLLRGKGSELSQRLKKAKQINDPVLKTVEDQAEDLVAALHAVMNAQSLGIKESKSHSKHSKNYLTQAAKLVVNDETAACVIREQAAKNPRIVMLHKHAAALNETLYKILSTTNKGKQ